MEKQFDYFNTFFDFNIDANSDLECVTPIFYQKNTGKKRIKQNGIMLRYLKGENLSEEELLIAKKISTGELFIENKKQYSHCKLCSNLFQDYTFSEFDKSNSWEVGLATQSYTPFGMLAYLKDRRTSHKESFADLTEKEFYDLFNIMKKIYFSVEKSDFDYSVVGVNVLFNQITVSQLCLHGHIEFMIKNADQQGLGCKLEKGIPSDKYNFIYRLDSKFLKYISMSGLRIEVQENYREVIEMLKIYINNIYQLIKNIRYYQSVYKQNKSIDEGLLPLLETFSPAPVMNIYTTFYRGKTYISIVPELFLEPILPLLVANDDEGLYCLKYNEYHVNDNSKLLFERAPLIRPSIKVNSDIYDSLNYDEKQKKLIKVFENAKY